MDNDSERNYDAELREVELSSPLESLGPTSDIYLHGLIYDDRTPGREPFIDGTFVNTSKVAAWDEATQVATTQSGTRYKISLKGTAPAGEAAPGHPVGHHDVRES